jgi:hypothetical protein
MAVKAVNDSAGPDGLVPTLLVFGAYPRMTDDSPPSPSLIKNGMAVYLRDITQAYTQSETHLQRLILAYLPEQIRHQYPEGTIIVVLKPLYGIAEAGTHWWATYSKHHKEKLLMTTSIFDPCFLIITTGTLFGIIRMQTNNIIILGDN